MENKTTEWMSGPAPTVCRCCLAEGCYKDISTEYFWMGKREVYAEMLSETFDLSIAYAQTGGPNSHSRLICEPCISRLRDASEFKKQVQECEKTFINHLDPCSTTVTVEIEPSDQVKLETVKEEQKHSDSEDFDDRLGFEDDDDDLDDQPLTKLASKPLKKEKADLLDLLDNSQAPVKRKSTLKAKAPPAKKAKLKIKEKAKPSPSKAPTKTPKKKKDDDAKATAKSDDSDGLLDHISVEFEDDTSEDDAAGVRRGDGGRAGTNKEGKLYILKSNTRVFKEQSKEIKGNMRSTDKVGHVKENEFECDSHDRKDLDSLFEESVAEIGKEIEKSSKRMNHQEKTVKNTKRKKNLKLRRNREVASLTSQRQENIKKNTLALLKNSNMCLFLSIRNKFKCFCCNESYFKMAELRSHSNTHTNQKIFDRKIMMMRGLNFKSVDITSLCCKICKEECADLSSLKKHLIETHDLKFPGNDDYLVPYRLVTDEDFYRCVLCDSKFNTYIRLKRHMNSHYRNHVCETCGVAYTSPTSLRMHRSKHRIVKCSLCPSTFGNQYSKYKHMAKCHNVSISKRYCLLCSKTFRHTYQLNEHKITEHGLRRPNQSVCVECGKVFSMEQYLRIHMRSVHLKERNYPCCICSMRFFTKHDQKRHELSHEDVKSFSCSYCDTKFKTKDSLRRHGKRFHGQNFI